MNLKFSWYVSNQLQDWIVSKKPHYPNLEECIYWVKDKLKREDSNYRKCRSSCLNLRPEISRPVPLARPDGEKRVQKPILRRSKTNQVHLEQRQKVSAKLLAGIA